MFTNDEWEFFLTSWKEQYGQSWRSPFNGASYMVVPGNIQRRREMYSILIKTLISRGWNKEKLNDEATKNRIVEFSVPENLSSSKSRDWKDKARKDWVAALTSFFEESFESDNLPAQIRKSEQAEVVKFVPTEPQKMRQEERPTEQYEEKRERSSEKIELQNPWDDSLKLGIPSHNFEVDHEFLKLLRGDSDERQ